VLAAHALPRPLFDELVDAHGRDCEASPFADLQDMEEYAVSSCGSVLKLVARILGVGEAADAAAEHAGAALGLARQLQEYRHWASHERHRIPADLAQDPAGAVRAVKTKIGWHLAELDRLRVDRRARPALAAAAMARVVAGNAFDPLKGTQVTNWQRLSRIALANLTGRV
jgi:phytoene/squalene synthetase